MQDTIGIVSVDTNHLGDDEDYSKFKALVEGGGGGDYIETPLPPLMSTTAHVSRRLSNDPPVSFCFVLCLKNRVYLLTS